MKISVQTGDVVDRLGIEDGYKDIKTAGFQAIDWNLDHAWNGAEIKNGTYKGKCIFEKNLEEVIEHYSHELSVIKANGLEITQAHAPFPAYSKDYPEFTDYAIEVYKRNIEFCNYCGCRRLVIHGIPLAIDDKVNTPESIRELNIKLYSSLIPTLLTCNVTVCLENLFTTYKGVRYQGNCGDPKSAAELIDTLNEMAGKELFGLCLDTGHANVLHEDLRIVISTLGKRIKCLHIHDNNGSSDQHMAPCTGTINWNNFCSALKSIGYSGDLNFETFNQTNIALEFDRQLVIPWLTLIEETGEVMKRKILSEN